MKVMVMASGSKGNCTYIESNGEKILIDIGISHRKITNNLKKIGCNVTDISHVFITHEHTDHIAGLATFFMNVNARLYVTAGTLYGILHSNNYDNIRVVNQLILEKRITILKKNSDETYLDIDIKGTNIKPINAFHDATEPVGFIFKGEKEKLVYLTDTGYVHKSLLDLMCNADCYILECNHDPEILMNSNRSYQLKMRILSNHGHLSNEDALYILGMSIGANTKYIFYAHISEECNVVELIDLTRKKVFKTLGIVSDGIKFISTSQECLELVEV